MLCRCFVPDGFRQRFVIQSTLEDGCHGAVRKGIDILRQLAGGLQTSIAIGFTKAQDSQQASIGLLRMGSLHQQGFGKKECFRAMVPAKRLNRSGVHSMYF